MDSGVTNDVAWRPVSAFVESAERLFPEQLVAYLA
jgi:hypothetical protein